MHLAHTQCFSLFCVISTSVLTGKAQRGYVAGALDLNTGSLILEPGLEATTLKSSNPTEGPSALSLTHTY